MTARLPLAGPPPPGPEPAGSSRVVPPEVRPAALLKESAVGLPESPEVQYRLGLASLKVGDKAGARRALSLAAGSRAAFAGRDEATRLLAELR